MHIAYVNIWPGFDQNDYPEKCFFTRLLRESASDLKVDVGMRPGERYDLVLSMFSPMAGAPAYKDMNTVESKSICFTGESYDVVSTTPGCGAYIGFDHIKDVSSDVKYLRFPLYAMYHLDYMEKYASSSFEELRHRFEKNTHTKKYSAVVSNPNNQLRTEVIRILASIGLCDSGGAIHNTVGQIGWSSDAKMDLSSRSMYGLSFENRSKVGYITEKIYECFMAGTVPYYWGASDINEEFNPNSYHVFDSSSLESINKSIQHMIDVLSDDSLRRTMKDVDPFAGFRSEVYIKNGKQIIKDFIVNYIETK